MSILSYRGYQAKVWFSEEDTIMVGEVIGIPDVLRFHAERADEVWPMFQQCIDNYLNFVKRGVI